MKIQKLYARQYKINVGTYYGEYGGKKVDEILKQDKYYYILSEDVVIAKFKASAVIGEGYVKEQVYL